MNAQKHATETHLQQVMTAAQYTAFTAVRATLGSHSYNVTPRSLVIVSQTTPSGVKRFYINAAGEVLTGEQMREQIQEELAKLATQG